MSRLHCSRYTIPTHRPWWTLAWRAMQRAWLRHRMQCVMDERDGYLSAKMKLGPKYLENCERQIDDFRQRLAILEVHS